MRMEITGLVLWVQDNTLSVKFYKKLGFEVVESNDRHTIVQLGTFKLYLVSMRDEDEFNNDSLATHKGQGAYLYIHVDNVDAAYDEFLEKGVTARTKPRNWEWGNREFVVKDPDGYKLCFWQKITP
jgi:catechol 2,3-dioxygenase-like lactoylglutathione lyase family enzyme